jgi:hypothetical protein
VQNSATQRNNLVGISQFDADVAANALPSFSLVIGNLCDDAHDCTIPGATQPDAWLQQHLSPLFQAANFYQDTLLLFTWDESNSDNTNGGGKVEWAAFGATVRQGYKQVSNTTYTHESTLRLALKQLGVSVYPGGAASAPDMTEFFVSNTGGGPALSNIVAAPGPTSATITWTTDQSSNSVVHYGTTISYGATQNNTTQVTSHSVNISGLSCGTAYHFNVASTNASALTTVSSDQTFSTSACASAPVISSIASVPGQTGFVVNWSTDLASSSQVNYGVTTAYGSKVQSSSLVIAHSLTVSGLQCNSTYDFQVVSSNGASSTTSSANQTVTTSACPVISVTGGNGCTFTGSAVLH